MLLRCAVLLSLSFVLESCSPFGATYREIEIRGYPRGAVWTRVVDYAGQNGFRPDIEETDVGRRIYTSRWVGDSVAFRRSQRKRFRAELVGIDKKVDHWLVRFYIEVETVDDVSKNMNPEDDDWDFSHQDGTAETVFREVMKISFPKKRVDGDAAAAGGGTGR